MRMRQIWTLLLCLITQTFLSDSEILTIYIEDTGSAPAFLPPVR